MDKFTGYLTKIRLINSKPLLVRFTLVTAGENINCIAAREILANQIMMLPDDKYNMAIIGHFNKRKQFVVRFLNVINSDKFTNDLGL
ncbi:hypothetical protein [Enterococcus alishanensis]